MTNYHWTSHWKGNHWGLLSRTGPILSPHLNELREPVVLFTRLTITWMSLTKLNSTGEYFISLRWVSSWQTESRSRPLRYSEYECSWTLWEGLIWMTSSQIPELWRSQLKTTTNKLQGLLFHCCAGLGRLTDILAVSSRSSKCHLHQVFHNPSLLFKRNTNTFFPSRHRAICSTSWESGLPHSPTLLGHKPLSWRQQCWHLT